MNWQAELERIIKKAYKDGKTGDSLRKAIKAALRDFLNQNANLDKAQVEAEAAFLVRATDAQKSEAVAGDKKEIARRESESVKFVNDSLSRIEGPTRQASELIAKKVESAQEAGQNWRKASREAMRAAATPLYHIETEVNTFSAAMDRASVVNTALVGGAEYFRYEGPTGTQRLFCKFHVGKIYHISEIRKMTASGGLMVIYYGGGYNCRHRWVPWFGKVEGGVHIHEDWQNRRDGLYAKESRKEEKSKKRGIEKTKAENSKTQSEIMDVELKSAKAIKAIFKNTDGSEAQVELRSVKRNQSYFDAFVNNSPIEIKTPEKFNENTLFKALEESKKHSQEKNVFFVVNGPLPEAAITAGSAWLKGNKEKGWRCTLVFTGTKTFKEL